MKRADEMETDEAVRVMQERVTESLGRNIQVSGVQYRNLRWEGILNGDVPDGMHAYLYNDETGKLQFETREEPGTVPEPEH